ncbi:GAF domain-containing sensor histidine kinase [Streptomyces sp. WMMB 322]|uniref:sensor histidine kinase n=1 Tax=Streptomyces sp. WMMB 322 TaxID=1286821 RepID=UPI0006E3C5C1|nr:GAF domain-containing sensor histidine kinase [Streptomyces sp. WMMB 322]SCK09194.1 Histidine kinase-, DNA gyrase B-, and HSP90-like ATPase [Streptomyces sp. WMMB 322]
MSGTVHHADGEGPGPGPGHLPRMQLDDLLEELQVRIDAVRGTRDRMHGLLDAVLSVGRELELSQVLHRITEAAVLLVDAEYGALGVLGENGNFSQFIPVGVTEQQAEAIGALPAGHGLLGELIRNPAPLRLPELSRHPSSEGLPPDHPPMRSLLAVPIRVRDEVFGNLYLAEKREGKEFDSEDETVLSTLAASAGVAVENARLYEEARYRQRWMEANAEVTRALLSGVEERRVLGLIVELARTILTADLGALALPEGGDSFRVAVAAGTDAEHHRGLLLPREGSFVGAAVKAGEVITSADVEHDPRIRAGPPRWAGLGPAVAVPMIADDMPRGVLLLARAKPRQPFAEPQIAPLSAFAGQAAVAMELAERRRDAEQITLLEERDRIARDLHDLAIQRLFATGMTLQSATRFVDHPKARERLVRAVDDLDATIKIIRSTIFGLRAHDNDSDGDGLRSRVTQAVQDVASALGFTPALRMGGLLDTDVPAPVADEAVAVLREALSNVARHAGASSVEVAAETEGEAFTLSVVDDGCGIPEGSHHSGLQNLSERAERLGGELRLVTPSGGGTGLTWRVPLNGAGAGP